MLSRQQGGVRSTYRYNSSGDLVAVTTDDRAVLVQSGRSIPTKVERVDLATGARTLFKAFGPQDTAGLIRAYLSTPYMKPDGSEYVYGYLKKISTLFSVTPVSK